MVPEKTGEFEQAGERQVRVRIRLLCNAHRASACSTSCLDIGRGISDHVGMGRIDAKIIDGTQDHARIRFTATAVFELFVGTIIDGVEPNVTCTQHFLHVLVNIGQVLLGHEASRDASLIGNQHEKISEILKYGERFNDSGKKHEQARPGNIRDLGTPDIDYTVAVEKNRLSKSTMSGQNPGPFCQASKTGRPFLVKRFLPEPLSKNFYIPPASRLPSLDAGGI